jgi:hypothetical protein
MAIAPRRLAIIMTSSRVVKMLLNVSKRVLGFFCMRLIGMYGKAGPTTLSELGQASVH